MSPRLFDAFKDSDSLKHSLAGAGAGCVSSIVTCPLDVVKTRLQAQGVGGTYQGLVGTFATIWNQEGVRGLYRGLGPTIFGYLPTWAIYFTTYDYLKHELHELGRNGGMFRDDWVVHIFAAMTAGATGTVLTNPLWVVKTRFMTSSERHYRNTFDALRIIYSTEGIRGFYRGLGPSLIGVSHVAVQFPLYEKFKVWFKPADAEDFPTSVILGASSLSKCLASIATYPHEVIRTRLQNQTSSDKAVNKYRGVIHAFTLIVKEEGWLGLYRGMGTNLARTIPNSALTILTYEVLIRRLNPHR